MVIGGGGAAARAALAARERGSEVAVLVKGRLGGSGCTPYAASEWLAFGAALGHADPRDSPEQHYKDILEKGAYVCDPRLARILAYESPERLLDLESRGVRFDKTPDGRFVQRMSDGATYPRACAKGAETGREIMRVLSNQVKELGCDVYENTMAVDLISVRDAVYGVIALDMELREYEVFWAKAVVMATGGAGSLFKHNVFPEGMTGDGYAMAYNAGAELVNMEFIQIGPAILRPTKFDVGGVLWRLGPRLYNRLGEEYLRKYLPVGVTVEEVYALKSVSFPFSTRNNSMYIDIANFTEIVEGRGSESGCIYFDLTHVDPARVEEEAGVPFNWLRSFGVDLTKSPVEIAPAVQHFNGGVHVGEWGETNLRGLFAAGECQGGQHGADRPGGDALANCQVFGFRAGHMASKMAEKTSLRKASHRRVKNLIEKLPKPIDSQVASKVIKEIQESMWRNVTVVRTENGLQEALRTLSRLEAEAAEGQRGDGDVVKSLEIRNMIAVGKLVSTAAMTRKESRGTHYRRDYPQKGGDEWLRFVCLKRVDDQVTATLKDVETGESLNGDAPP
ncbi:MAG: FAD-binding protein [Candidatus Bathyarchaeia archaeon]